MCDFVSFFTTANDMDTSCSAIVLILFSLVHVLYVIHADSFLTLGINDCFERVSIGKRLNASDVTKILKTTNLVQCSIECERSLCNVYSFGVSLNGNSTCLLGADLPKSRPYDDPEYDLFMKILQCRDRTICFSKLVGARRLADKHIQRVLPVKSKHDCELFCQYEKEFQCQGFNFKYDTNLNSYSSCQLTSIPTAKLDLSLDFHSDIDYDFYEKNVNASPSCRFLDFSVPHNYGQNRKWGLIAADQDDSLWQDPNLLWLQKNDVSGGYGNDPVYYERGTIKPILGGLDINSNVYSTLLPKPETQPLSPNECFIKVRTGHHLQRNNVIKTVNALSLYNCETNCANEQTFICNIFSYRYSFTPLMDNCQLGDKFIRQLDVYQDLVPDRDSDVFVRNELSQPGCQPTRSWDTDCFERIRSGLTLQFTIIKFSVQAENLHECELMCLHVKHFTCRLFSFRHGSVGTDKWTDNCFLTDYSMGEMDPVKHFIEDNECDIFNRGSFGRGCEFNKGSPDLWSPTFINQNVPPPVFTTYSTPHQPSIITTTYTPIYKQLPPLNQFNPSYGPPSSSDYGPPNYPIAPTLPTTYSTTTRPIIDTSTKSGTYVPSMPPTTYFQIPGEYTPVFHRPLDKVPTLKVPIGDSNLYGKNPQVPQLYGPAKKMCYISYGSTARLLPPAIKKSMIVSSEMQCKMECNNARENAYFRCSTISYFDGFCDMSDIEMRDLKPNQDYSPDQRFILHTWDFSEVRCYISPKTKYLYPGVSSSSNEWTWMRFTVNGQPCKSGTYCSQNDLVGIWSCPVDQGGWDYCCRPDHHCGYTDGVSFSWCYVGKLTEQWRPCSDQYYPSADKPQRWPVIYIHNTGPPVGEKVPQKRTNDTVPSISKSLVDQFMSVFQSDAVNAPMNATEKTFNITHSKKYEAALTNGTPLFQIVDVIDDKTRNTQSIKLYSYGNNIVTNRLLKRRPYI